MRTNGKLNIRVFSVISILLLTFCVLKVLRGADSGNESAGGIWNYISVMYYPLFLYYLVAYHRFSFKDYFVFSFLYVLFSLAGVLLSGTVSTSMEGIYSFLMIPYPFLVFAVFYYFAEDNLFAERVILITYYACLLINSFSVIRYQFFSYHRAMASDVYYSLCLFPFCLILEKNNIIRIVATVVQAFTIFTADKRAGLVAFAIGLVGFLLISNAQKGRSRLLSTLKAILISIAIIIFLYFLTRYIDQTFRLNIYTRLFRSEKDEGSGRIHIYAKIWDDFLHSDILQLIIGHGKGSIINIAGTPHAHNDFLEAIYVYGIVPAICLVGFYIALIRQCILMIIRRSRYAGAFFFSLVVGITLSTLSFFLIYFTYVTGLVAFWGYVLSVEQKERSESLS